MAGFMIDAWVSNNVSGGRPIVFRIDWLRYVLVSLVAHLPLLLAIMLSAPMLLVAPLCSRSLRSHSYGYVKEFRGWSLDILIQCSKWNPHSHADSP